MATEKTKRHVVEKVDNLRVYSDGTILIQDTRISYPHVDAAWGRESDKVKKFSGVFLLDKKTHKAAKDVLVRKINEILKEKKIASLKSDSKFLKDGNDSGKEDYDGYWTVNASELTAPSVRDSNKEKMTDPAKIKARFKPGHRVDVLILPWWQDNEWGKKVNANLKGVRYRRPDEELGDGSSLSDEDIDETFDDDIDDDGDSGFEDDDLDGL